MQTHRYTTLSSSIWFRRKILPLLVAGLSVAMGASCLEQLESGQISAGVGPDRLRQVSIAVTEGGPNPVAIPIVLTNAGDCALDYSVDVGTTDGADWLGVDPADGSVAAGSFEPLAIDIDVVTPALTIGTYTGSLVVTGSCGESLRPAQGSPVTIAVNLTITPTVGMFTVGGAVTGLSGTGLLLQNNSTALIAIDEDGSFAFPAADGSTYAITIAQQPTGSPCTVYDGSGTVSGADVTDVSVECGSFVVPYYGGPDLYWNDYVLNDGTSWFDASGTACDGTESGFYNECLHTAEMLTVEVVGRTECTYLSAEDALDAFNWVCRPDTPWVRMVSVSLKNERRLGDLIDDSGDPVWRPNAVTVLENETPILTTSTTVWWANPLEVPALSEIQVDLDVPLTIYVVPEDTSGTVEITASQVGFVVMPGATLTGGGSIVTTTWGLSRLWIEGSFLRQNDDDTVRLDRVHRSVIRHVAIDGGGLFLVNSSGNRLADLYMSQTSYPFVIEDSPADDNSRFNVIERLAAFDFTQIGVSVEGQNNVLSDVLATNGRLSLNVVTGIPAPAASNVLLNSTMGSSDVNSVWLNDAPHTTIMNAVSVNTGIAFRIQESDNVLFYNVSATDSFLTSTTLGFGINVLSPSTAKFGGLLIVGQNDADKDCLYPGGIKSCLELPPTDDGYTVTAGATLAGSFVDTAVSSDAANPDDTDGTALFVDISNWVDFDNRYRGWGKEPPETDPFPSYESQHACSTGTCRIWDWRLRNDAMVVRTVLDRPFGTDAVNLVHTWHAADAIECAMVRGAAWRDESCLTTFLNNAVELTRDGYGNDNLLCESGEHCLYTQNLGAYQGEGPLIPLGPGGVGGDVYLYRFTTTGTSTGDL